MANILVIDDDPDMCTLLQGFLSRKGHTVQTAFSARAGLKAIDKGGFQVILCDFRLPDGEGVDIINHVRVNQRDARVIIITGYSDVKVAINCIKKGAVDYVIKPLNTDEILLSVDKALKHEPMHQEVGTGVEKPASRKSPKSDLILGKSPQSQQVHKLVELVAPTEMSVIVTGETGTGKEYVARSIHALSTRADGPFVALDCGALPKELAASEMFGHKKGSFTGALQDKKGSFLLADGGTLFLDEIANLSYENQVKLLRVLQERKIRPIGESKDIAIDVRIVAATNEKLWDKAQNGAFREDLYHRLNEFSIELTALRHKPAEIEQFAEHFVELANQRLKKRVKGISKSAMEKLRTYYWHGNLRELKNLMKRAVLVCQKEVISLEDLPTELVMSASNADSDLENSDGAATLKEVSERAEKRAILKTLKATNYNKSMAAKLLDVDRKTLYNKINAYGIDLG